MDQDIIDNWRDMKKMAAEKRAANRASSPAMLAQAGFGFETKNNGAHLIVACALGPVDYWPGTGRWIHRVTQKDGRGVQSLIAYLKRVSN